MKVFGYTFQRHINFQSLSFKSSTLRIKTVCIHQSPAAAGDGRIESWGLQRCDTEVAGVARRV